LDLEKEREREREGRGEEREREGKREKMESIPFFEGLSLKVLLRMFGISGVQRAL